MAKKDKYGWRETFPRYFKADIELQQKVGTGKLDQSLIDSMQARLDAVAFDVGPELRAELAQLASFVTEARADPLPTPDTKARLARHVMNIKANAGMFKHGMVARLAAYMLGFLEDLMSLDPEALDIVEAFVSASRALVEQNITDETHPAGQSLLNELRNAVKRYEAKHTPARS